MRAGPVAHGPQTLDVVLPGDAYLDLQLVEAEQSLHHRDHS